MIIGGSPITISQSIAAAYNANNQTLAETLARIALGKKVDKPSDDFVGYVRAQNYTADISTYEQVKQDITNIKSLTAAMQDVGNTMYQGIEQLRAYARKYAATTDPDEQQAYTEKFDALKTSLDNTITASTYDNNGVVTPLYQTGSHGTVTVDATGTALDITITNAVASPGGLAVTDGDANFNTELSAAASYLVQAEGFGKVLDLQSKLADTIINSKEAAKGMITDIDDVKEINKATELQIRAQAGVAMLSQANVARAALVRLYGGSL
jgi:flagellin-like hook-associated protein FlgL